MWSTPWNTTSGPVGGVGQQRLLAQDGADRLEAARVGEGQARPPRLAAWLPDHGHDRLELALVGGVDATPAPGLPQLGEQAVDPLGVGPAAVVVAPPVVLPEAGVGGAEDRASADEAVAAVGEQ